MANDEPQVFCSINELTLVFMTDKLAKHFDLQYVKWKRDGVRRLSSSQKKDAYN